MVLGATASSHPGPVSKRESDMVWVRDKIKKNTRSRQRYVENREAILTKRRAEYAANPEPFRQRARKYKPNKVSRLNVFLKSVHGISLAEYQKMAALQSHCCAICKTPATECTHGRLCVDHDHVTGKMRGLLCIACNSGIGYFKDSLTLLVSAGCYLEGCQ